MEVATLARRKSCVKVLSPKAKVCFWHHLVEMLAPFAPMRFGPSGTAKEELKGKMFKVGQNLQKMTICYVCLSKITIRSHVKRTLLLLFWFQGSPPDVAFASLGGHAVSLPAVGKNYLWDNRAGISNYQQIPLSFSWERWCRVCIRPWQRLKGDRQWWAKWRLSTFDLWPIPLGGGTWGAWTNMWHPETPASYESIPAPLATQIPTLGYIHLGGGGVGGSDIRSMTSIRPICKCRGPPLVIGGSCGGSHCRGLGLVPGGGAIFRRSQMRSAAAEAMDLASR